MKPTDKADVPAIIPCAHDNCPHSAIVRIQTATGWAKLCEAHYVAHYAALAQKNFTHLGLDRWADESRDDHRKRVFEYLGLLAKGPKRFGADGIEEAA